jgi:hypothetical protein
MCCSASNCLHISCCCFCCWVLILMHCDQIEHMGLFQFSYISWGLLCALRYDLFWRKFHDLPRIMYIVWMLDEIFCRHQLGPIDIRCYFVLEFLYWFCVWMTYLLVMGGIKVSHYHCIGGYKCFKVHKSVFEEIGWTRLGEN